MYDYQAMRPQIFTEDGQVMFLKIRDRAHHLIKMAGAVTMGEAIRECSGDSWTMVACVDRLVELGELREIEQQRPVAGQNRVFVKGHG